MRGTVNKKLLNAKNKYLQYLLYFNRNHDFWVKTKVLNTSWEKTVSSVQLIKLVISKSVHSA